MKTSASPQRRKDAERSALSFVLAACVYLPILWGVFWAAPALTYTPAGQMAAVSLSFAQFSGGSAAAEEAPEPTPATAPEPAEEAPPPEPEPEPAVEPEPEVKPFPEPFPDTEPIPFVLFGFLLIEFMYSSSNVPKDDNDSTLFSVTYL